MPNRYRKKAIEVEAVQWTGENREEVEAFVAETPYTIDGATVRIWGATAAVGDWLIKTDTGRLESELPTVFETTYEPVGQGEHQTFTLYRARGSQGWFVAGEDFRPTRSLETLEVVAVGQGERAYTREELLSDDVIETLAREAESRWAYSPDDPAHTRIRSSIRREVEAACDAIDKGKGGGDA
jgi:hypothetical protein